MPEQRSCFLHGDYTGETCLECEQNMRLPVEGLGTTTGTLRVVLAGRESDDVRMLLWQTRVLSGFIGMLESLDEQTRRACVEWLVAKYLHGDLQT